MTEVWRPGACLLATCNLPFHLRHSSFVIRHSSFSLALDSLPNNWSDDPLNQPRRHYGKTAHFRRRRLLFSSGPASGVEGSPPRRTSSAASGSSTATRNCTRNSGATTHAPAAPRAGSSTAACGPTAFDGIRRDHFFPRVGRRRRHSNSHNLCNHDDSPAPSRHSCSCKCSRSCLVCW